MNNEQRTANIELTAIAETWLGTPWCANSAVKGVRGGVACHNLPRAILVEAGWLPDSFPLVEGDPNSARNQGSVMERWLDGRPEFRRLQEACLNRLHPGDVFGIRIRRCIDHLGLSLGGGRFIHVLMHKGAAIDRITDPTWSTRLLAVWRPIANRKS
jgi:cell wall-associated NlpC family hydrolase